MRIVIDLQGAQTLGSRHRGIGRYTNSVTRSIIENGGSHEVILALNGAFPETLDAIKAQFSDCLDESHFRIWMPVEPVYFADPANDQRRNVAEAYREHFLAKLEPDVIHISSLFEGFGDNAVSSIGTLQTAVPTSVTLYDLIPLINQKAYLENPRFNQWYLDRLDHLRRADLLLAISESSRLEAVDHLSFPDRWSVNVGTAADPQFKAVKLSPKNLKALGARHGLIKPFVLYTGGIDHRKNIEGLIRAYGLLPKSLRQAYQLAIVCSIQEDDRIRLARLAAQCGLGAGEIIFTGYIPETDLIALYSYCALFVFPSWHEGFGLPALEAMWCDAPVIAGDRSSLPEVVGRRDALFDPMDDRSISSAIERALTDEEFCRKLVGNAKKQRTRFSWNESGKRSVAALEALVTERRKATLPSVRRPKLAYVSPVPPARTGIADYSAELLPELSRHYDIDVVLKSGHPDPSDPFVAGSLRTLSVDDFRSNFDRYDRILYHFGNSDNHEHMFDLLELTGGVVVLHDFFLSGIVAHGEWHGGKAGQWWRELYISHGYPAVQFRKNAQPESEAVWKYPCNGSVLDAANGIIVHSANSRRLAQAWYGETAAKEFDVIPHLRVPPSERCDRDSVRGALSIGPSDFLVCSFGLIGPTKLNHRLVEAWHAAGLHREPDCKLVFVGQNDAGEYGDQLAELIRKLGVRDSVHITGWADINAFRNYLCIADVAVQLRTLSRGETSGTVLDALNYGVPLIVNSNGAMADLPADIVTILPDEFESTELADALQRLRANPARREAIGNGSRSYIRQKHSPRHCADLYRDSIERSYARSGVTHEFTSRIRSIVVDSEVVGTLAERVDREMVGRQPRLFVDVSELAAADAKTGIQRVVRSMVRELLSEPLPVRVEPCYLDEETGRYRFARSFMRRFLDVDLGGLEDDIADLKIGDTLLCLDLNPLPIHRSSDYLADLQRAGVRIVFVVYDLLPVKIPDCFPQAAEDYHRRWLEVVLRADEAICISEAVADDLRLYLKDCCPDSKTKVSAFPLGADFDQHPDERGLEAAEVKSLLRDRPTLLMVGTIEPRKEHAFVLDSVEAAWSKGLDINLCIVGKQGWMVEPLIDRIHQLEKREPRMIWLPSASDGTLKALYQSAICLVAASKDEGFGLPIVEAAQYGLPVVARDIPVFREVGRDGVSYFSAGTANKFAEFLSDWLKKNRNGQTPSSARVRRMSWRDSSRSLLAELGFMPKISSVETVGTEERNGCAPKRVQTDSSAHANPKKSESTRGAFVPNQRKPQTRKTISKPTAPALSPEKQQ